MNKFKIIFLPLIVVFLFLPVLVLAQVRAYRNESNQTIPTGVATKVQLNAENYDVLEEFDSSVNYRFTAKNEGYYLIYSQVRWQSSVDQKTHDIMIYKNGALATEYISQSSGTGILSQNISDIIFLNIDDYVELWAYQNSGGDLVLTYRSHFTFMTIHKLLQEQELPDQFSLIKNEETGAEFYLDKTLSYGDIMEAIFLSIFSITGTCVLIGKFVFKN